jgi:hypothetical protein
MIGFNIFKYFNEVSSTVICEEEEFDDGFFDFRS